MKATRRSYSTNGRFRTHWCLEGNESNNSETFLVMDKPSTASQACFPLITANLFFKCKGYRDTFRTQKWSCSNRNGIKIQERKKKKRKKKKGKILFGWVGVGVGEFNALLLKDKVYGEVNGILRKTKEQYAVLIYERKERIHFHRWVTVYSIWSIIFRYFNNENTKANNGG